MGHDILHFDHGLIKFYLVNFNTFTSVIGIQICGGTDSVSQNLMYAIKTIHQITSIQHYVYKLIK